MASVASTHFVRLKNQSGTQVAVFDNFILLEYRRHVNDVGNYVLEFYDNDDSRFESFEVDGQIEIWRSAPAAGLDWYMEFEGFHRKTERVVNENGDKLFRSIGVDYNDLLARTCIAYKAGTIRADKNTSAEQAMKEYVEENCGPTADDTVVGRLYVGGYPNFSVDGPIGYGITWTGSRAFSNLLDVLQEVANYSGIDFAVVNNGDGAFVFKTYYNQLGVDRSNTSGATGAGRNAFGNIPIIFSVERGNVKTITYTNDRLSEANVVIVTGAGDLSLQQTATRYDSNAIAISPWNRREVSRPATQQEFTYQLEQSGDEALASLQAIETVEFEPFQQPTILYGLHYSFGDKVTVRFGSIEVHKRIMGVQIRVNGDGIENLSLELKDIV